MNRSLLITLCFVFAVATQAGVSQAQDVGAMMDEFYDGLADIIERNMSNPDRCVEEVDDYYADNQGVVDEVREMSADAMEASAEMMEKAMSMTEEELEAFSIEMEGKQFEQASSPGADRYADAMEAFSTRHPMQGMNIAMKAMQFMPGTATQQAW